MQSLAAATWHMLLAAEAQDLRVGEETVTDLLTLSISHSAGALGLPGLRVAVHNKRQEAHRGADWDLWIVEDGRGLGLRFQAKVNDVPLQRFHHLHYASGQTGVSQAKLLIASATKSNMVPLYLLYQSWTRHHPSPHLRSVGHVAHGCSVLRADWVSSNVPLGKGEDLSVLAPHEMPWQLLFCGIDGLGGLPEDVARRLQTNGLAAEGGVHVVDQPPDVSRLLDGRLGEGLERPLVVIEALTSA